MTEREKPLGLDMDPDEAFARFLRVDPGELPDNVRLRQKKGPPKRPQVLMRKAKRLPTSDGGSEHAPVPPCGGGCLIRADMRHTDRPCIWTLNVRFLAL
jgi:hypothetical protein